ncbi:hypothetical protein BV97_01943 [Novosphingobium resinovorum]|uniref:Uncharacterized protein n=1 Tax=Novosphingobium resinovorum TaxID=158500 RepID=A0A031JXI8_9SPHN|nr:hypothetical protein [Novosphingobium resinovorum]EZP82446.1 hypothetical protein BV97_01943 [Novosphingobium resinovorum]
MEHQFEHDEIEDFGDVVFMTSGPQMVGHIESDRPAYYVIGFIEWD